MTASTDTHARSHAPQRAPTSPPLWCSAMSAHIILDMHDPTLLACELPRWRDTCEADRSVQWRPVGLCTGSGCCSNRRSQAENAPPQLHRPVRCIPDGETILDQHSVEPTYGTAAALVQDPSVGHVLICASQKLSLGKRWRTAQNEKLTLCSCEQDALPLWWSSRLQMGTLGEMRQRSQRQLSTPPVDTVDPSDEEHGLEGAYEDEDEDEDEELTRCLPSKGSHHYCRTGCLEDAWMRGALADGRFIVPC